LRINLLKLLETYLM